jgi:hypothetical protein
MAPFEFETTNLNTVVLNVAPAGGEGEGNFLYVDSLLIITTWNALVLRREGSSVIFSCIHAGASYTVSDNLGAILVLAQHHVRRASREWCLFEWRSNSLDKGPGASKWRQGTNMKG